MYLFVCLRIGVHRNLTRLNKTRYSLINIRGVGFAFSSNAPVTTVGHTKTRSRAGVGFVAGRHGSSYLFSEEAAASTKLAASGFKTHKYKARPCLRIYKEERTALRFKLKTTKSGKGHTT